MACVGIAVFGTLVVQFFSRNLVSQLTGRGVSRALSTTIAQWIAAAGADAGNRSLPTHFSIAPVAYHQAITQTFVDAIHSSFLICGLALLVSALVVALTFQRPVAANKAAHEAQVTTAAQAAVPVNAEGKTVWRALPWWSGKPFVFPPEQTRKRASTPMGRFSTL